jgi:hypothetical protein
MGRGYVRKDRADWNIMGRPSSVELTEDIKSKIIDDLKNGQSISNLLCKYGVSVYMIKKYCVNI